jgi:hypothetical protein
MWCGYWLHSFWTSILDKCQVILLGGGAPCICWSGDCVGSSAGLNMIVKEKSLLLPGNKLFLLTYWRSQLTDHVDGVRQRLWTAATNGLNVHPPDDIRAWRIMVEWCQQRKVPWFVHQSSLANLPPESAGSKQEERTKGMMNLALWSIFVHTCKLFFACRKILRHGSSYEYFTSPLKEGVLRIFIALKNPSPLPGVKSRTLGPMAVTLTITPPRRLATY